MTELTGQREDSGARKPISQRGAARVLGVTQEHLNRVLRGHWQSKRLVALYNELMTIQGHGTGGERTNEKTKQQGETQT